MITRKWALIAVHLVVLAGCSTRLPVPSGEHAALGQRFLLGEEPAGAVGIIGDATMCTSSLNALNTLAFEGQRMVISACMAAWSNPVSLLRYLCAYTLRKFEARSGMSSLRSRSAAIASERVVRISFWGDCFAGSQ